MVAGEAAVLGFRGAPGTAAVVANEDAPGPPGRLPSEEDRAAREVSSLDPADCDDGSADQAVPVVQVQRQRDVLTAAAEQVAGELSC
jgi:hypothetical protein